MKKIQHSTHTRAKNKREHVRTLEHVHRWCQTEARGLDVARTATQNHCHSWPTGVTQQMIVIQIPQCFAGVLACQSGQVVHQRILSASVVCLSLFYFEIYC